MTMKVDEFYRTVKYKLLNIISIEEYVVDVVLRYLP